MKKIYLNQTDYKGEVVILIKFPFNRQLIDHIKTIKNAKWSQSLRNETLWNRENETYKKSESSLGAHQNNGHPIFRKSYFMERLFIASSEVALGYPGYMEGAIISAKGVFDKLTTENS
jgi:monoamine oxidase